MCMSGSLSRGAAGASFVLECPVCGPGRRVYGGGPRVLLAETLGSHGRRVLGGAAGLSVSLGLSPDSVPS